MSGKRVLHCWAGNMDDLEFGSEEWAEAMGKPSGTCMLESGHSGPHDFTPDSDIEVEFL